MTRQLRLLQGGRARSTWPASPVGSPGVHLTRLRRERALARWLALCPVLSLGWLMGGLIRVGHVPSLHGLLQAGVAVVSFLGLRLLCPALGCAVSALVVLRLRWGQWGWCPAWQPNLSQSREPAAVRKDP